MPEDIREVEAEQYWDTFETMWTNLLSYRYLGRTHASLDKGVSGERELMKLRHDMRNSSGGIMAAPLCIASPESGGMGDDLFVPNPVSASMQVLDAATDVREIEIKRETIKIGRTMGFSRSDIVDADHPERLIARSEGLGVSLGGTPPGHEPVDNPSIDVVDSPDLPPLHKVFGAVRRPDASWTLPELTINLASPDAALHLGPQHIVLEAAAMELAADVAGGPVQVEDWHVMFVARGKTGPFRVDGSAVKGGLGRIGVRLNMIDEGNAGRVVTTGQAVFRPV